MGVREQETVRVPRGTTINERSCICGVRLNLHCRLQYGGIVGYVQGFYLPIHNILHLEYISE